MVELSESPSTVEVCAFGAELARAVTVSLSTSDVSATSMYNQTSLSWLAFSIIIHLKCGKGYNTFEELVLQIAKTHYNQFL